MVNVFAVEILNIYRVNTTISRVRVNDYIGMELYFGTCQGTLIISMIKYLHKTIDYFLEVLRGTKDCPTGDKFFKIRYYEDREVLPEEMARQFHRTMAQLLFCCKRARTDIKTLVSFLTTRVKEPDV